MKRICTSEDNKMLHCSWFVFCAVVCCAVCLLDLLRYFVTVLLCVLLLLLALETTAQNSEIKKNVFIKKCTSNYTNCSRKNSYFLGATISRSCLSKILVFISKYTFFALSPIVRSKNKYDNPPSASSASIIINPVPLPPPPPMNVPLSCHHHNHTKRHKSSPI